MSCLQLLTKQNFMIHRNVLSVSVKVEAFINPFKKFNFPKRDSCFLVVRRLSQFHAGMDHQESKKTLCIKDYDAIGFDIDHTLAKYNIPNLFDLVHHKFAKVLVEERGNDASLLEPFEKHKDLCTRGLCVDLVKGNFLKIGKDGVILRANHGTRTMNEDEIQAAYGQKKIFAHYDKFMETVDNIKKEDDGGMECFMFDNFYDMIAVVVLARMVDVIDKKNSGRPNYFDQLCPDFQNARWQILLDKAISGKWPKRKGNKRDKTDSGINIPAGQKRETYDVFGDLQAALTSTYHYKNFAAKTGGFFPNFEKHTGDYVEKLSTEVKEWIKKLKDNGKTLFLMTSSYVDFASCTMNYILGPEWKQQFDSIITYSRKPSFFYSNNHFRRLDGISEKEPITELRKGEIYSQGNFKTFNKLLARLTGKDNPKVLYFGDGLRADIVPAKKYANWDTVYIYEEMETELGKKVRIMPDANRTNSSNEDDNDEPTKKKLKVDEEWNGQMAKSQVPNWKEREYLSSSRWGSFLVDDVANADHKLEATMYGILMRKYTDLAVPQISYIADLPLDHQFNRVTEKPLSSQGFYQRPPEIFRNMPADRDSKDL